MLHVYDKVHKITFHKFKFIDHLDQGDLKPDLMVKLNSKINLITLKFRLDSIREGKIPYFRIWMFRS